MNKFMGFLEEKVLPTTHKIASQRHLLAIRKGVLSTLPLTIIGSFFVILLNFPIEAMQILSRLIVKYWTSHFVSL